MTAPRTSLERDLAATAALALYSFVVAVGFARVFSGWDFLAGMTVLVIVGHGSSFALRRVGVSGWITVPFTTLLLLWLLIVQHYPDTMSTLLPTSATWDQIELEVGLVRDQFQTAVAPVLYDAGWATLAGFALIVTIAMSDAFAFRAEARGESLVPGGVLFVFIAALGSERLRIISTVLLIGAGVLAVVALRALHDRSRRVELVPAGRRPSLVLPAALVTAAVVAVLAGIVGPRIPGAYAEPLYDTKGRGSGVNVLSPLVDIRSRLTNRSDVELFRVNADRAAYWRVTALPEFDGRTFGLPQRTLEPLDASQADGDEIRIRQQLQVLALGGMSVPAAADPIEADGSSGGESFGLRINRDTSTLIAPEELGTGDLFTIVSSSPTLTPDELRAAGTGGQADPIYTELPDDLPEVVFQLAEEVTAGAPTAYDRAMALQNWFRTDFDYSLEVQSGHGANAIESFLDIRVGYCEQFSATFAAMARSLGIPSRVAVGYTPGIPDGEGWYQVFGKNAHAWPELWFDGIGWVGFEPTPGRGAPGAESYTGLAAEQDDVLPLPGGGSGGDDGSPRPTEPTTPSTVAPPPTTAPSGSVPGTLDPNSPAVPDFPDLPEPVPETSGTDDGGGLPWRALLVIAVAAAALVAPTVVRRWRARIARSRGPLERVQEAWARARHAVQDAGVDGTPSMTAHEWVTATASELPIAARPMGSLADVVDRVTYGRPGSVDLAARGSYGSTIGRDCELWSEQVARIATDTLSTRQRVVRYFTNLR